MPLAAAAPAGGSLQDWAKAEAKPTASYTGQVSQEPPNLLRAPEVRSQHDYETISEVLKHVNQEVSENSEGPFDMPSYQFVIQLEPYATSPHDPTDTAQSPQALHTPTQAEVEEIADLEDKHSTAMYARVSKRIKSPTPPPVLPPDDDEEEEEEEAEEVAPPLPERALDTDDAIPSSLF